MIHSLLVLALSSPCVAPPGGSEPSGSPAGESIEFVQDGSILQRYDLMSVLPSFDAAPSWSQTMHEGFSGVLDESGPFVEMRQFYEGAAPESISELVTLILGDDLHHEGRVVSLDGNSSLLVLAPPAVHKKVALVLGAFERALSAHTRIQVDILDMEEGELADLVQRNVIPLADADRFVSALRSRGARHRLHTLNLSPGRTAILRQLEARSLIVDYDVEVAERALAFDPRRLTLHEGVQLLARGVSSSSGTHLSLLYSDADFLGAPRRIEAKLVGNLDHDRDGVASEVDGPDALQTGEISTRSVACTTFLGDDSALVFGSSMQREGKLSTQVFVLRKVGGVGTPFRRVDIPDSARSLLMVNTEILGIPAFDIWTAVYEPSQKTFYPVVQARLNTKPTAFLSDWLKYRFSVWRQLGPWAVIITDPAWDDAAVTELENLISSIRPGTELLSASVELVESGSAGGAFRWSLPCLPGFECGVVLQRSSTALVDYDVEVAQGASVYDPEVVATYQGLMASFGVSLQGQSLLLNARGSALWPSPVGKGFTPGGTLSSALEQPAFSALGFDERRLSAPNQVIRFGASAQSSGRDSNLSVSFEIGK